MDNRLLKVVSESEQGLTHPATVSKTYHRTQYIFKEHVAPPGIQPPDETGWEAGVLLALQHHLHAKQQKSIGDETDECWRLIARDHVIIHHLTCTKRFALFSVIHWITVAVNCCNTI